MEEIDGVEHAIGLGSALFLALLLLPAPRRQIARRAAITALLALLPFTLVTSGQCAFAGWRVASSRSGVDPRPTRGRTAATPAHRLVVVVLDEWDQFLSFEDRTPGLELPTFDALAAGGVYLTRGVPPGTITETVLPSLLTGRPVVDTGDAGHSDRLLRYEDGSVELFSDASTFLSLARERGFDAALVGWYHPYCRVAGDDLVACRSRALRQEMDGRSLAGVAWWQATRWLEGAPQGRKLLRAAKIARPLRTDPSWHDESCTTGISSVRTPRSAS